VRDGRKKFFITDLSGLGIKFAKCPQKKNQIIFFKSRNLNLDNISSLKQNLEIKKRKEKKQ
jgi:hypothetical protein